MARVNEKECLKKLKQFILKKNNKNVFSNCEINEVSKYVFAARENPNTNEFPDFIFDGGGIEHFQLTSSEETKKGSEFKIEENKNKQKYENELNQEFLSSKYEPGTTTVNNYKEIYESFSYEYFLNSLKRNISNHVNSLEKSHFDNKIVFFLMEQQTARLWIDKGLESNNFYKLHKDKKALTIIKEVCHSVNYLIYLVADSVEIIELSKVDDLLETAIIYESVKGGKLINLSINQLINL